MENNGVKRERFNPKHAPIAFHFKIPYVLKRNAGACLGCFVFVGGE